MFSEVKKSGKEKESIKNIMKFTKIILKCQLKNEENNAVNRHKLTAT